MTAIAPPSNPTAYPLHPRGRPHMQQRLEPRNSTLARRSDGHPTHTPLPVPKLHYIYGRYRWPRRQPASLKSTGTPVSSFQLVSERLSCSLKPFQTRRPIVLSSETRNGKDMATIAATQPPTYRTRV